MIFLEKNFLARAMRRTRTNVLIRKATESSLLNPRPYFFNTVKSCCGKINLNRCRGGQPDSFARPKTTQRCAGRKPTPPQNAGAGRLFPPQTKNQRNRRQLRRARGKIAGFGRWNFAISQRSNDAG
jgi:hypothetical protein